MNTEYCSVCVCVCVQCILLFNSMHLSRPIVFITLLQYFEHHIIVTHATLFSSCAIFENHLMGMKTYKRYTSYSTKQQPTTSTQSNNIITIINATKLEWESEGDCPHHFAFNVSIKFEQTNGDDIEIFSCESHYVNCVHQ